VPRELARYVGSDVTERPPGCAIRFTLTRESPEGWGGHRGRIDRQMLDEIAWPPDAQPLIYVCGPSGFVETAATALIRSGHQPARIKTKRYGPAGQ
jgi:ferredoxin-NADP reductase